MGLIEMTDDTILWRGLDYYDRKKVAYWRANGDGTYDGVVRGSGENSYNVHLDMNKPEKNTTCDCPYAEGNKYICKHMLALYFEVNPDEAEDIREDLGIGDEEDDDFLGYDDEPFDEDSDADDYYNAGEPERIYIPSDSGTKTKFYFSKEEEDTTDKDSSAEEAVRKSNLCDICKKNDAYIQVDGEGNFCLDCYNARFLDIMGREDTFKYPEKIDVLDKDGAAHSFKLYLPKFRLHYLNWIGCSYR